jgi:hypothetical protein
MRYNLPYKPVVSVVRCKFPTGTATYATAVINFAAVNTLPAVQVYTLSRFAATSTSPTGLYEGAGFAASVNRHPSTHACGLEHHGCGPTGMVREEARRKPATGHLIARFYVESTISSFFYLCYLCSCCAHFGCSFRTLVSELCYGLD